MSDNSEDLQREVAALRAEVAGLRKTIHNVAIAIGVILLVGLVPGLGALAIGLAFIVVAFVLFFGTIGAALGTWTGRATRGERRHATPAPPLR